MKAERIIYIVAILISVLFVAISLDESKALVALLLLLCLKRGREQEILYNPYLFFSMTLISYLIYYPPMNYVLFPVLTSHTKMLAISCMTAVIIGFYIIERKYHRREKCVRYNDKFWLVFIIGVIPTVISYYLYGSTIGLEGEELVELKSNRSIPVIGQLTYFLQASIIVACYKNNSKYILISLAVASLASLLAANKSSMLITILFAMMGLYKFQPDIVDGKLFKKIKKIGVVIIPVLLFSLFMFNNNSRAGGDGIAEKEYSNRGQSDISINNDNLTQNLFLDYCYICSPWGNLDYNIRVNKNKGYGRNTFAQFGKKLGITIEPAGQIVMSFLNTTTFITDFYLDFGNFGAVIASLALGMLIFFFYKRFGLSNSALQLSFYVLICYATFMMFFSNHFVIGYLLNYAISFGIYYFIFVSKYKCRKED